MRILASLFLFSVDKIQWYRDHFIKQWPLSKTRVARAESFISNYIKDLTLGTNLDNRAYTIGSADQAYVTLKNKLSLVLYHYLYFGWDQAEIEYVFGN